MEKTRLENLADNLLIDVLNKLNVKRIKFTPWISLGETRCHNDVWDLKLMGLHCDGFGTWWQKIDGCYDESINELDLESINKVLSAIDEGKFETY